MKAGLFLCSLSHREKLHRENPVLALYGIARKAVIDTLQSLYNFVAFNLNPLCTSNFTYVIMKSLTVPLSFGGFQLYIYFGSYAIHLFLSYELNVDQVYYM